MKRKTTDLDADGQCVDRVTDGVINRTSMTGGLAQTGQCVPGLWVFLRVVDHRRLCSLHCGLPRPLHQPKGRPEPPTDQVPAEGKRVTGVKCPEPGFVRLTARVQR